MKAYNHKNKDKLEHFITEKRPEFEDKLSDKNKIWSDIKQELPPDDGDANQKSWLMVAASLLLIATISYLVIQNYNQQQQITELRNVTLDKTTNLYEVEQYYTAQINLLEQNIDELSANGNELSDSAIEPLQNEYNQLKRQLLESGPNPQLMNAMIHNLRKQKEIVEYQLELLEKYKEYKTPKNG